MDFHKIRQEHCEATGAIRERFGVENALSYLVGEKTEHRKLAVQ